MSGDVFCNICGDSGYVDGKPCVCFKVRRLVSYAPRCIDAYMRVSQATRDALENLAWKSGNTLIKLVPSWGNSQDTLADKALCLELYWLLANGQKTWAEYGSSMFNQVIWKQFDDRNRFSDLNRQLVVVRYGLDEWDTGSVEDSVSHFLGQFRDAGCKVLFIATNKKPLMPKWSIFFSENKFNIVYLGESVGGFASSPYPKV
jgi:hypothetical protein